MATTTSVVITCAATLFENLFHGPRFWASLCIFMTTSLKDAIVKTTTSLKDAIVKTVAA